MNPQAEWIALLGRRDFPTDGVRDYCTVLAAALENLGIRLNIYEADWKRAGRANVMWSLWKESANWGGRCVLVQYTALSWSRRGFPVAFLLVLALLRMRGARIAVVCHDVRGFPGDRWRERLRRAFQHEIMQIAYGIAHRVILPVPLGEAAWLPRHPRKAVFIPVGSNIPVRACAERTARLEKTLAVFGVTGGLRAAQETEDIAIVARFVREKLGRVRLLVLGRGAEEARAMLEQRLSGVEIDLQVFGVLPAEEAGRKLADADALLFVRGEIDTQRSSALAGIASGLPVVAYGNAHQGNPLAEAGVEFVTPGDRAALARGAARVLEDEELRHDLQEKNRHVMKKFFSWDAIASSYADALAAHPPCAKDSSVTPKRYRLLIMATHPVQYAAPLFRRLAQHPDVELLVAYCSLQGAEPGVDPEFEKEVVWDIPLLGGYSWVQVKNFSPRPGLGRLFGLVNPGLWKLVRNGRFSAVTSHAGYNTPSFWILLAAAKRSGIPFLFCTDATSLQSQDGRSWKARVKSLFWPSLFRLMDHACAGSSAGVELMRGLGIPEERVTLAPFVVDNDWWIGRAERINRAAVRAAWGIPEQGTVVVFSGKLQPWKRPMDLLRAFRQADVPSSFLIFAGDGPLRGELERETRVLGLSGRVRVLGFVNQTGLPAVYCASDLLVLPSGYEPFGVAVNEAMLCGRPAVVSDRVGARSDLVQEGETGFTYPAGDVKALSEILKTLLSDPARLARMGEAARHRMEQWSPEVYIQTFLQAVKKATERKIAT